MNFTLCNVGTSIRRVCSATQRRDDDRWGVGGVARYVPLIAEIVGMPQYMTEQHSEDFGIIFKLIEYGHEKVMN